MTAPPAPLGVQRTQALDCLFSHLGDPAAVRPLPAERPEPPFDPASAADPGGFADAQPPPQIENAADLQAAHEWVLRERQRLDMYTRSQLARVQTEHQAFVQRTYLQEQAFVLRTQELNRKDEMLMHQVGALRQQAAALAERERKLAPYLDPLWNGREELAELRRVSSGTREDVKGQRALLERLRSEAACVEREREAAQAELGARAAALQQEKAALTARQANMNQRLLALDEAEAAARRRAAELDELDARMRRDVEEHQEQQTQLRGVSAGLLQDTKGQRALLERLRAEAASLAKAQDTAQKRLAAQAATLREERESLAARQAQLTQRLLALEEAEAATRRRAVELDELEAGLRRDFEEQERQLNFLRQEVKALDPSCVQG